jgi:hypothetical protein
MPKPSAALIVAVLALVLATTGTAFAASSAIGDNLIKKHSLSGNRLRAHTLTSNQINMGALGTVPKANLANHLPALTWVPLNLENGWQNYNGDARPPSVAIDAQGIVHLRGAIRVTTQTSTEFAILPSQFRPLGAIVWLTADMVGATTGRVYISPTGTMNVQDDPGSANSAKGFTSLDGITYSLS